MGRKISGRKLARSSGYRKALNRNLVTDLLNYEKITTTEAKAKEVRGLAEKMITLGKGGGLNSRRQALSRMRLARSFFRQQFLYFLPLPQGHGSLRPTLATRFVLLCFFHPASQRGT